MLRAFPNRAVKYCYSVGPAPVLILGLTTNFQSTPIIRTGTIRPASAIFTGTSFWLIAKTTQSGTATRQMNRRDFKERFPRFSLLTINLPVGLASLGRRKRFTARERTTM